MTSRTPMIGTVRRILRDTLQLGDRADAFTEDTELFGSIAELDSMAVVAILTLVEEELGVTIRDDDITAETFATVGSLADFLETLQE